MNSKDVKNIKPFTIGQVAKLSSVGVETVRFYERKGLITEPPRKESGYRQYPQDAIRRIQFIRSAKELGFSLKEISELLSLRVEPGASCADVRKKAVDKISDVKMKIGKLKKIKIALTALASICNGRGPTSECPILDALDSSKN